MRKEITVNGKTYPAVEVTFNVLCDMDEMGVSIEDLDPRHIIRFLRAYVAVCMGATPEDAGVEIGSHVMSGGAIEDLIAIMTEAFEEGGFFRTQQTGQEAPAPENTEESNPSKAKKSK